MSIVRVTTDVACIATICQSVSLLQCSKSCTPIESVVWVNLFSNAIFSAVVQGILIELYINEVYIFMYACEYMNMCTIISICMLCTYM
jgi:hypothetical protein